MYKRFHKTEMRWKGWKLTAARLKVRQPEIKKPNTRRKKQREEEKWGQGVQGNQNIVHYKF